MVRTRDKTMDKELKRIVRKAFRRIEKMYREEPHPVIISDADEENSAIVISEVTSWLFQRRQDNGDESDPNSN